MNKNSPKYESLRSKLIKLSRFSDSGDTNETRNARFAIERLCSQYGVSVEEITSEVQESRWYEFDIGRSKFMLSLFAQCHGYITGKSSFEYLKVPRSSRIKAKLTAIEYAELKSMFDWHQANYKAELQKMEDTLFDAYIHKHNLFSSHSDNGGEKEEVELTPEMLERIKRIIHMKQILSDNHYHKMIEQ